jgi:adenylate kinase family enzyme
MSSCYNLKGCIIVLLGPPCGGKGTQGALLSKLLNIPTISTGDIFRKIIKESSNEDSISKQLASFMNSGELIPESLVVTILEEELSKKEYSNGFILDGYPRQKENLDGLDTICKNNSFEVVCAIQFNVPDEVLYERLKTRQTHNRVDDTLSTFSKRLALYKENIPTVSSFYHQKHKLIHVDNDSIESIRLQIEDKLHYFLYQKNKVVYTKEMLHNSNILKQYCVALLKKNINKQTGNQRRYVVLLTSNKKKKEEITSLFDNYGVEVISIDPDICNDDTYNQLFKLSIEKCVLLGVLRETTFLLKNIYYSKEFEKVEDFMLFNFSSLHHQHQPIPACNYSELECFEVGEDEKVQKKVFKYKISGIMDVTKKTSMNDCFNWDDVFISKSGYSLYELAQLGLKVIPRHINISSWIINRLYYKKMINLKTSPIPSTRPIDFDVDVWNFIENSPYYTNSETQMCGIHNYFKNVVNDGVVFKTAVNRRIKNYWLPGLNSGIPITVKDDDEHTFTYLAHDLGHFGMPDLIFTGNHSIIHKKVYMAWRMMSEALTMIFADMLYVNTRSKLNPNYNFTKRRIFPLFQQLKIDFDFSNRSQFIENIRKIMYANYQYCLCGDLSAYKQLLKEAGADEEVLNNFVSKYEIFFVEDYKWTNANYENMIQNADLIRYWYHTVTEHGLKTSKMLTIDEVVDNLRNNSVGTDVETEQDNRVLLDNIFDYVFVNMITPKFDCVLLESETIRLQRTFLKWIVGQISIFAKYSFLTATSVYQEKILSKIKDIQTANTDFNTLKNNIYTCRQLYEEYLETLKDLSLLTSDDVMTFKETYPMFQPVYCSYKKECSSTIKDMYQQIMCQLHLSHTASNEDLMRYIITEAGGIIDYDEKNNIYFVVKPGIKIMADTGIDHPNNLITFLIAGISVETEIELVSHREAKVARLTTSKTKIMDVPLFRIYPFLHGKLQNTLFQKLRIIKVRNTRNETLIVSNNIPREISNINNLGSKVIVLTYSITLADLHDMFIGRTNEKSNESEMRDVVAQMIHLLHSTYPNQIKNYNFYLNANNESKLLPHPHTSTSIFNNHETLQTTIHPWALKMFKNLHIPCIHPPYLQLAEFMSKLTYMSWNSKTANYCHEIIYIHNTLSILSGYQIVVDGQFYVLKDLIKLLIRSYHENTGLYSIFCQHFEFLGDYIKKYI